MKLTEEEKRSVWVKFACALLSNPTIAEEWVQEYIHYCQDWGETPRSRSAVTEQFKKMGAVSARRSDGIWYYLEVKPLAAEKAEEGEERIGFNASLEDDLPF